MNHIRNLKQSFFPDVLPTIPEDEWTLFHSACSELIPYITDTTHLLHQWHQNGERILFEGAQGVMLDIDFGTYPFVTSSSTSAGGASTGSGLPPHALGRIFGIMKAYTTRVGSGPFPTELVDDAGKQLRDRGHEYGASTGRPRRCGWLDLFQMKYACQINGFHGLFLTKLDVLDGIPEIPVCTGYRLSSQRLSTLPHQSHVLERVEPVYTLLPGWKEPTAGIQDFKQLPQNAQDYVSFIASFLETPIFMVSTGPERTETITLQALW